MKLTPEDYYYKHFKQDFEMFWTKVPHGSNYATGDPSFRFAGLIKRNANDALEDINNNHLKYFLSSLACTILIDQLMYSRFKKDYQDFRKLTYYPKMKVGWINANPWTVFHKSVLLSRGIKQKEMFKDFAIFAQFFLKDLKTFFETNDFSEANWENVRNEITTDSDINKGEYGRIFLETIKNFKE